MILAHKTNEGTTLGDLGGSGDKNYEDTFRKYSGPYRSTYERCRASH